MPADQYIDMYGMTGGKTAKALQQNGNGKNKGGGQKQSQKDKYDRKKQQSRKDRAPPEKNSVKVPAEKSFNSEEKEVLIMESKKKETAPEKESLFGKLAEELKGTSKAYLLDPSGNKLEELAVKNLADRMKGDLSAVDAIIFDGVITQKLLDIAGSGNVSTIIATRKFGITKQPENLVVLIFKDLN